MTPIERLWLKAKSDATQELINEALIDVVAVCNQCGSDSRLDKVSGC